MKVVIFNVKYSPNLGDGLLAQCLERELAVNLPTAAIETVDLAGRLMWNAGHRHRGIILTTLGLLPPKLRNMFASFALSCLVKFSLRTKFRESLQGCDAVIIGGGNLFSDSDLNFPMKIAAVLAEANRKNLPVGVYAVGVTRNWSQKGHALFAGGLTSARIFHACVRDRQSQDIWAELLASSGVKPAKIAGDPGLLASRHFERGARACNGQSIGLCITDPTLLRYHAGAGRIGKDLKKWFGHLAEVLVEFGYNVVLFTNGSPEDRVFLRSNAAEWIGDNKDHIRCAPDPMTPAELVKMISSFDALIAHRMHACIVAHSFGIPTVGLTWDVKLESFFDIAGRSEFLADPLDMTAAQVAALAARALSEGVDAGACETLLASARSDVAELAIALCTEADVCQ